MAYALNTNTGTKRFTLSSSGDFTGPVYKPLFRFSQDTILPDNVTNLVSIESVFLKHPSFFHEAYMTGYITRAVAGAAPQTRQVTSASFENALQDYYLLHSEYYANSNLKIAVIDKVLFYLLKFLKTVAVDVADVVRFRFMDDGDTANFGYNVMSYSVMAPHAEIDITQQHAAHAAVVERLVTRRNMNLFIEINNSPLALTLTGNFMEMFGCDPSEVYVINQANPLPIQIPIHGHQFMCLECNLIEPQMVSVNGEKLTSSDLMTVIPTPSDPGQTEYYMNYTTGGKSLVSSDHLDSIQLAFTDIRGNNVLSMEEFMITILLDQVVPVPNPPKNENRISLKDARYASMHEMRKKLRTAAEV